MVNIMDTVSSVYLMHKYWGKKPGYELKKIVEKYTNEGDCILDPFSGYGGIGIEGILLNRNVVLNDLNPVANFIASSVINYNVDLDKVQDIFLNLKKEYLSFSKKWYTYKEYEIITILRDKTDKPIRIKVKDDKLSKFFEINLTDIEVANFLKEENEYTITDWYPDDVLIKNSRIGAKSQMKISDLFPKRALICQSYLFGLILKLNDSPEKELLKLAFTSNLANCSKLVPPISSRGQMSQGAWMTGYYIGEKYLENNVFHYFENRVKKIIKGKRDFQEIISYKTDVGKYIILNSDAKSLPISSNTIDFVFTDFPYGDTVPYFEQSQLWNAWLKNDVDYSNEIVVSDSPSRNKGICEFAKDVDAAVAEIFRVLKPKSYFVFTFHSLCGDEWTAISNALSKNGFRFIECELLTQKTCPPRQLNRRKGIRGDLIVVYQKNKDNLQGYIDNVTDIIGEEIIRKCDKLSLYDTNELIILCVNKLLSLNGQSNDVNFVDIINKYFEPVDEKWRMKNEVF